MKILLFSFAAFVVVASFSFIAGRNPDMTSANVIAGNHGIQFIESDWNRALREAKKQRKLIFLDAYASWCGPCKSLKKNTFPDPEVGDFFNKNFINVAVDMEKGDGPALSQMYQVDAYPTLIITDATGKMLAYTKSYINPKQLLDFGKYGFSTGK